MYGSFNIKGLKKTTNETIVEVQVGTSTKYFMLSQVAGDDQFDRKSQANKDSLLLKSGEIIHNMYDLDKMWYHNQAARRHRYPYEQENYDYQHIYRKPNEKEQQTLSSMTKLGDTIYALDTMGTKGHSFINDEMYKWLINDNGWSTPPCSYIATMLYAYTSGNQCLSNLIAANSTDNTLSNYYTTEQLQSTGIFATSAMIGVKYNTIYEIPGSIKQDYSKNEVIANTFKTKSQYNAEWTMLSSDGCALSDARSYSEVRSCGGTLWLKYKTSENYVKPNAGNDLYTIYPNFCKKIEVTTAAGSSLHASSTHVEVITRINRGVESPQHKTSLYSLNLNTTLIDKIFSDQSITYKENVPLDATGKIDYSGTPSSSENIIVDDKKLKALKQTIKNEIKNCIRNIAENIAPANSQLFSVSVNE